MVSAIHQAQLETVQVFHHILGPAQPSFSLRLRSQPKRVPLSVSVAFTNPIHAFSASRAVHQPTWTPSSTSVALTKLS